MLVLPALIGIFWGAPLIARELEAGTHRLVWNQSVTRTRWLAVKLGLVGLAADDRRRAGQPRGGLVVQPDRQGRRRRDDFSRIEPLLFGARGIVPIGYAAFAFALGVTVGMLVRRTLPAMAVTLAVFVAVQIAMPLLVRPHLMPPARATVEITPSNVDEFICRRVPTVPSRSARRRPSTGAWVLSSHTVDASGRAVETSPASRCPRRQDPARHPRKPPAHRRRRPGRRARTLPGRDQAARLPAAGDLPARQPLLALPVARDRDLHRPRPRPLGVLLLAVLRRRAYA